jgi:hypothetical protein
VISYIFFSNIADIVYQHILYNVSIFLCILCFLCSHHIHFNIWVSANGFTQIGDQGKAPPSIEVPELSFDELKEKTDDFGSKALVGEGSYGRVYYAVLENGTHVAVKKLDTSADPEPDDEFIAQVWLPCI